MTVLAPGVIFVDNPNFSNALPRVPSAPSRIVLHTTETPPGTGKHLANIAPYPYHIFVEVDDLAPTGELEMYQTGGLQFAASSLVNPGYVETNHMGNCIQISFVTYAARINEIQTPVLDRIADLLRWICGRFSVQKIIEESYGADAGFILASTHSRIRYTVEQWTRCNKITYHQRVTGNDHWDCGKFAWKYIQYKLDRTLQPTLPEVDVNFFLLPGMNAPVTSTSHPSEILLLTTILHEWFNSDRKPRSSWDEGIIEDVKEAQAILNLRPDGYWGPLTARQFRSWATEIGDAVASGITEAEIDELRLNIRKVYRNTRDAKRDLNKAIDLVKELEIPFGEKREILNELRELRVALDNVLDARAIMADLARD